MNPDQKNKNDFTCTTFKKNPIPGEDDIKVNFMKFVHRIDTYQKWLATNNIEWDYINVYWRRSGDFKERISK